MIIRTAILSVAVVAGLAFATAGSAEAAPLSSVGAVKISAPMDWGVNVGFGYPGRVSRVDHVHGYTTSYQQQPIYGTVVIGYDLYGNPLYGTGIVGYQTVPVTTAIVHPHYRVRPSLSLGLFFGGGHHRRHHHH